MKITDVEVIPFTYEDTLHGMLSYALIKMKTDTGLVGWGEACDSYCCTYPLTIKATVDDALKRLLIGEEPQDIERLVMKMRGWTRRRLGSSWVVIQAISGIEIALWDLAGKAAGKSVAKMLGQKRDRVKLYASAGFVEERPPEEFVKVISGCLDRGVKAFKIRMGVNVESDLKGIGRVRELVSKDVSMLVDGNENYDLPTAKKISRRLEEYDALHFEEPIPQEDLDSISKLVKASEVPIAYGEHLFTVREFEEVIRRRAADILQPDATLSGGILESKRICELATSHKLRVIPHFACGPVGLAADLHLCAVIPKLELLEYSFIMVDNMAHDLLKESTVAVDDVRDGCLRVPDGPGLGIDVDEDAVRKHPYVPKGVEKQMPRLSLGRV